MLAEHLQIHGPDLYGLLVQKVPFYEQALILLIFALAGFL
jgi:hypothetical protein